MCVVIGTPLVQKDGAQDQVTSILNWPTTGITHSGTDDLDKSIVGFLRDHNVPGASLAVSYQGKLIYARGYGYADRNKGTLVYPNSLFRLASVSKPITSAAIVTLLEDPKSGVTLDTPVYKYLGYQPFLNPGQKADPRIWTITVGQLLHHTGGDDTDARGFDVMFQYAQIAKDMKIESPPDHKSLIQWAMGQWLNNDPGTHFAYSNYGFSVLGRVIEKASGMTYEKYVQKRVLEPMGITDMQIGGGHQSDRRPTEVTYYARNLTKIPSVYSSEAGQDIPGAYAKNTPTLMDSHGGWIGSSVDLVHFVDSFQDPNFGPVINDKGAEILFAAPPEGSEVGRFHRSDGSTSWYGSGWFVDKADQFHPGVTIWHDGIMWGTQAILVRRSNGYSWSLLLNGDTDGDIDGLMEGLYHKVDGLSVDLWPTYQPAKGQAGIPTVGKQADDLGATDGGLGFYHTSTRRTFVLQVDLAKLKKALGTSFKEEATGRRLSGERQLTPDELKNKFNRYRYSNLRRAAHWVIYNVTGNDDHLVIKNGKPDPSGTHTRLVVTGEPTFDPNGGTDGILLVPINIEGTVNKYRFAPDALDNYIIGYQSGSDDQPGPIIFQGKEDAGEGRDGQAAPEEDATTLHHAQTLLSVTSAGQKTLSKPADQTNEYLDGVFRDNLYQAKASLDPEVGDHLLGKPIGNFFGGLAGRGANSLSSFWTFNNMVLSSQKLDKDSRVPFDLRIEGNSRSSLLATGFADLQYNSNQEFNNSQAVAGLGGIFRLVNLTKGPQSKPTVTMLDDVDKSFTIKIGVQEGYDTATYGLGRPRVFSTGKFRGFGSLTTKKFPLITPYKGSPIFAKPVSLQFELDGYSFAQQVPSLAKKLGFTTLTLSLPFTSDGALTLSYSRGYDPGSAFTGKPGGFVLGFSTTKLQSGG